jgi:hypothetical protein
MSRNENNYANICKPCLCSPPLKNLVALTNCFFQFVTRSILKQNVSCLRNRWWYQDQVLRRTFPCAIRTTLVFAWICPLPSFRVLLVLQTVCWHTASQQFSGTHFQQANKFHVSDLRRQHALNSVDYINRSNWSIYYAKCLISKRTTQIYVPTRKEDGQD